MKYGYILLCIVYLIGVVCGAYAMAVDTSIFVDAYPVFFNDHELGKRRFGIKIVYTSLLLKLVGRKRSASCMIDNWEEFCPLHDKYRLKDLLKTTAV